MRKNPFNRLSVKVFLITFAVQIIFGAVIIGILYNSVPQSYDLQAQEKVNQKFQELVSDMREAGYEECGKLMDDFHIETGAYLILYRGTIKVGSYSLVAVTDSEYAMKTEKQFWALFDAHADSLDYTLIEEFMFDGDSTVYTLRCASFYDKENVLTQAIRDKLPLMAVIVTVVSIICSVLYTYLFARPVRKLSQVSSRMADLDFDVRTGTKRKDEIGDLGRSLDSMSVKLGDTLGQLQNRTEELEKEIKRVNELESQKDVFFAAASHELKTPVTILEGQIQGMIDGVGPYKDRDEYLPRALGSVRRMESLINEILTVSKMQSSSDIAVSPEDFSAILEEKTEEMKELFESRGITLEKDFGSGLMFEGNRELTSLAMGTFLSNAVFYSKEGAAVTVSAHESEGKIKTVIRNSGAHIDEKDLPHLFEAFYRTDSSRSRRSGGSGLGLYLAKLIIEKQGGSCSLSNNGDDVVAEIVLRGAVASDK